MSIEIQSQEKKPLLLREEIKAAATFKGATPSRQDVKKEIASKLKKDEKLVVVKNIITKYGEEKAEIIAHVYENEKDLQEIEQESTIKRNTPKKAEGEEAAAEAPAEEKAEEKPAEEAKEEAPAEEKKEE